MDPIKTGLKVKQTQGGAHKIWGVLSGVEIVGRVVMRFGDVTAYGPTDEKYWHRPMRDENGAIGQPYISEERVMHYLHWAVFAIWSRALINRAKDAPPPMEFELVRAGKEEKEE